MILQSTISAIKTFLGFVDTPGSYSSQANKVPGVNASENALEFKSHDGIDGAGSNSHSQIDTHISHTSNPHSVTKTQVGLGNVTDDAQLKRAAGDIASFSEKVTPVSADLVLIEDSVDSNNKKKVQVGNLPGGGGGLWEVSGGVTRLITADEVDFQKKQAQNMLLHQAATLPSAPLGGQIFEHTPTGRCILYVYNATLGIWVSMQSIGAMALYVDKTDGTDSLDKGGAVDAGAFKTNQFAIDAIPGSYSGNIIISTNNESYTENITIQGKNPTGNFTITLQGELALQETVSGATVAAGGGTAQGTVTSVGDFAGDTYTNLLAYFVTDDEYRLIDSHTDDVLTLVGTAPSSTTQDVKIYDWSTQITAPTDERAFDLLAQKFIIFKDIKFIASNTLVGRVFSGSNLEVHRCHFLGNIFNVFLNSFVDSFASLYADSSGNGINVIDLSEWKDNPASSKIVNWASTRRGIEALNVAAVRLGGTVVDGTATATRQGVRSVLNSVVANFGAANAQIKNCASGSFAASGGVIANTFIFTYTGNTTDESPSGASDPAYID